MRNQLGISRRRQVGFSLVELMISLVIGMVIIGAVFAAYLSSGTSSRASHALAQITEDATIALNVMRSSVAMVGYGTATSADTKTGKFVKRYAGVAPKPGLVGCDNGFTDDSNKYSTPIETMACDAGDGDSAVAVAYEADTRNSVLSSDGVPIDCLGQKLALNADGYYLAYNRYYVSGGALYCLGPTDGASAQVLVENVESLEVRYGVASGALPNQAVKYVTASSMNQTDFDRTVSVRICVVVRSSDEVLDQKADYLDCAGSETTPADKRLYRAFTTTVVLQNRVGVV